MIIPNGKNKSQVYQAEYKNQSIWNDVLRRISTEKTALAIDPNAATTSSDSSALDQVMNESNNPSMRPHRSTVDDSDKVKLQEALNKLPPEKIKEFLDSTQEVDSTEIKKALASFIQEKGFPCDVLLIDRPNGGWEIKVVPSNGMQKITKK